jgi:hypothetical protein
MDDCVSLWTLVWVGQEGSASRLEIFVHSCGRGNRPQRLGTANGEEHTAQLAAKWGGTLCMRVCHGKKDPIRIAASVRSAARPEDASEGSLAARDLQGSRNSTGCDGVGSVASVGIEYSSIAIAVPCRGSS